MSGHPLSPDAYHKLLALTAVLLCRYDPSAYRARSSGTFAEAVAAGIQAA